MEIDELENVSVLDDAVALIRRRPDMYLPSPLRGPYLASKLVHDVAALASLPVAVTRDGSWWLVSAGDDWLRSSPSKAVSFEPFHRIVPCPDWGRYAFRSEILLTAFADSVVTAADARWTWIVGAEQLSPLPADLRQRMDMAGSRRHVAFRLTARSEE